MKLRTSIKVLGAIGFAQLLVFGCSSTGDDTSDQSSAASAGKNITIIDWDQDGVPTFIIGDLGAAPSARTLAPAALAAPLTVVTPTFRASAPNLVFSSAHHDAIGDTHYRFRQRRDGRDVIGAELVLHVRNGSVYAA